MRVMDTVRETIAGVSSASPSSEQRASTRNVSYCLPHGVHYPHQHSVDTPVSPSNTVQCPWVGSEAGGNCTNANCWESVPLDAHVRGSYWRRWSCDCARMPLTFSVRTSSTAAKVQPHDKLAHSYVCCENGTDRYYYKIIIVTTTTTPLLISLLLSLTLILLS